jgi:hypothetical protein
VYFSPRPFLFVPIMLDFTKWMRFSNANSWTGCVSGESAVAQAPPACTRSVPRNAVLEAFAFAFGGLTDIRQPQPRQRHSSQTYTELLKRLPPSDRLGQSFGQFIEFVIHTFPIVCLFVLFRKNPAGHLGSHVIRHPDVLCVSLFVIHTRACEPLLEGARPIPHKARLARAAMRGSEALRSTFA